MTFNMCLFFILFIVGVISSLSTLAHCRMSEALASSTHWTYTAMFRLYLAFLVFAGYQPSQVMLDIALAFLECLQFNGVLYSQMLNYVSAIRSMSIRYSLDLQPWNHPKISMYLKSVQKSSPTLLKMHNIIDIDMLKQLIKKCDCTFMGTVFKVLYLVAFFGFLRLSNLTPHSISSFSHLKHLCRGDVFFSEYYVNILIKWSKTMQLGNQARLLMCRFHTARLPQVTCTRLRCLVALVFVRKLVW